MFSHILQPIAKYDPTQPRDEKGQWVTLYHGTRTSLLPSIFKEGLRPSKEGLVFATESREAAQRFAEGLEYPNPTPDATVVEIRVPKSAFFFEKPLTPGRESVPGQRTARFPARVRPEWLITKFDPTQARDPKGTHTGGRFTKEGAGYTVPYRTHTSAAAMRHEPLPPNLLLAEERIRFEENEHLFLIRDGKPFMVLGSDDLHHVFMGDATPEDLKDAVMTHNHPSGFGLSKRDGMTATEANVLEMRAVTKTGTHVIRRTGDRWPPDFDQAMFKVNERLMAQLTAKLQAKKITAAEANAQHHILMYQELAQILGGFTYTFEAKKS